MRPDLEATIAKIAAIRARLASSAGGGVPPQEVENALSDGYAQALAGDAWLTESERRLREIIDDATIELQGRDLRVRSSEHRDFKRRVSVLRRELETLRRAHDSLHEHSPATSS